MLKPNKLLIVSIFAGALLLNKGTAAAEATTQIVVAVEEKSKSNTINQLICDLKDMCQEATSTKIMDAVETKIRTACNMPLSDQLYLKIFQNKQAQLFNKLAGIEKEALELCALSLQKVDSSTYNPSAQKAPLIEKLLECSKLNTLKVRIARLITQSAPDLAINKDDIENCITNVTKKLMDKNLTEKEMSDLITFFSSAAFKKIVQHADEFIKLVIDNTSPSVAKKLQQIS